MPRDSRNREGRNAGGEFVVGEPLLLICINNTYRERGCYDAVRHAWKVDIKRLKHGNEYKLVLARIRGDVVGAWRPTEWLPATLKNFPDLERKGITAMPGRFGFYGEEAEPEVWNRYAGNRLPDNYRTQNPVRYLEPKAQ